MRDEYRESYEKSASSRKIKAEDRLIGLLLKYPSCIKYTEGFNPDVLSTGFIRKVYDITVRLINDSVDTDLIQYSGLLTDSELGRLSGIIARSSDSVNPKAEFKDCIKAVNEEYASQNSEEKSDLKDDSVFLSELNKLGKNNNNT